MLIWLVGCFFRTTALKAAGKMYVSEAALLPYLGFL